MDIQQKPETVIAISSVAIAFCALGVSLWQMSVQRRHNRLTVRPLIHATRNSLSHIPFRWSISNVGAGPAIITKYRLTIGSQSIDFPSNKLLTSVLEAEGIKGYKGSLALDSKTYIKAGEEMRLLEFDSALVPASLEKIEKILWEIEYESLYREKESIKFTGKDA